MFGGTTGFTSPVLTSPQHGVGGASMIPGNISPNTSAFGVASPGGGGSPVFQSSAMNKFPAHGGPIVFTPHSNISPGGGVPGTVPISPYAFGGGAGVTRTSLIQSPNQPFGASTIYSPPPYSSTMVSNSTHLNQPVSSPVGHGYPVQFTNVQPFHTYGSRNMPGAGGPLYQNPYHHHPVSPYYGHHSPRDEFVEPMHCSPVGGQGQPVAHPTYHPLHRSPSNPTRPQYLPAYFTGVDHVVAAVPPRPRRVFDRSPSTSPPAPGATGSRSPQSKSPNWGQQDGGQLPSGTGLGTGQLEGNSPTGGMLKRLQGQGPSRQLRFSDTQYFQNIQAAEEKEKAKRSGPPVRGFGASEEVSTFLTSLQSKENNTIPGAVIANEAIASAGGVVQIAESNWITVFGFPAAAASFILTHFSQYGSVIQSKSNPGGNWLHIQYASRIDARRALSCNGKVLGGSIMVGVISSPKEVIEAYEKPHRDQAGPGSSTLQQQMKSPLQERNAETLNEPGKVRIRPLVGSSQLAGTFMSPGAGEPSKSSSISSPVNPFTMPSQESHQNENIPLPKASSGVLTKAMEYMFGW